MGTGSSQYVRVGEASIAYRVIGTHGPYLLDITGALPGLLVAEHRFSRRYSERVTRVARHVVFDAQGAGKSDPLPSGVAASVDHQAEQAIAVLESNR